MEISLIIVNYNSGALLEKCLISCLKQVQQIIIIDNASSDQSLNFLKGFNCQNLNIIIKQNNSNLGFSAACNIGIKLAEYDTLLFLNPDALLLSDVLLCLSTTLYSQPDIGMCGALILDSSGSEQPGCRRNFPDPVKAFSHSFGLTKFKPSSIKWPTDFNLYMEPIPQNPVEIPAISGACMLVKRRAIEDVGLWDEGYFLHCEDLDWCMRFHKKGWKIMFVPDAKVSHVGGACSKSRPIFVEWHKHKGMLRFYEKFYKDQHPILLWPAVVLSVWLRFSTIALYYSLQNLIQISRIYRA